MTNQLDGGDQVLQDAINSRLGEGKAQAKTSQELADSLFSDPRQVRRAIRQLIAQGAPIASSTDGQTGGYYLASTPGEAKEYMDDQQTRIIENCKRLRDFKRAARPLLYPGQLPLI